MLLAFHVLFSTSITQYNSSDLGLLSKLPATFWIGLLFLGILLYLSTKFERRAVFVAIVVVLISFYIFGIPTLIRENKAENLAISYWLSSKGVYFTSQGHNDFSTIDPWENVNWPGFFYNAAFLSSNTGFPVTVFADYFPLLTIALLGIITYSILRTRFNASYSSLGALWVIASLWTGQHYFSPQATAYVMYFAILLLLAKFLIARNQKMALIFSVLCLFVGVVITHLLTSFIILLAVFVAYALYKIFPQKLGKIHVYSISICILIAVIFFAYNGLIINRTFTEITKVLYYQIVQQQTSISVALQSRSVGSINLIIQRASTYSIVIINIIIAILAILTTAFGLLLHKKEAKNDLFWVAFVIVAGLFGTLVVYGGEAINRAFMFLLVPTSYFAIKFLGKKSTILILVLVTLTFVNIPAQYTSQNYTYVPSTELKGCNFFVSNVPFTASYLYEPVSALLPYKPSNKSQIAVTLIAGTYSLPSKEMINYAVNKSQFLISSKLQKNFYLYFYGVNLFKNYSFDDQFSRVYDNEGFQIFAR